MGQVGAQGMAGGWAGGARAALRAVHLARARPRSQPNPAPSAWPQGRREQKLSDTQRHAAKMSALGAAAAASKSAPAARESTRDLTSGREASFLLATFRITPLPTPDRLVTLAGRSQIEPPRLSKWFNNRRSFKSASKKRKAPAASTQEPSANGQLHSVHAGAHGGDLEARMRALVVQPVSQPIAIHANSVAAAAAAAAVAAASAESTSSCTSPGGVAAPVAAPALHSAELKAQLHTQLGALSAAATLDLAAAPAAAQLGTEPDKSPMDLLSTWLDEQHLDPFLSACCCDSVLLERFVELHGRSDTTTFILAGACVLRTAFRLCEVEPPTSLSEWQTLLADVVKTARVSRQSDSLWYHVRRSGKKRFCESVPRKAKDDTLTSLAILAAVAPHDPQMKEMVSATASSAGGTH